ncbi:hypothetical protein ACFQAS_01765 [Halopenitus salinus]|uniref:Uncharacterized protein n=1 Tax=Halopenitus salinus TaxID=1198295 RepID=A0ABD5UWL0_9EURY
MPFGIDNVLKMAPPMLFWPAVVASLLWVELGEFIYIASFFGLVVTGGISYVCARRVREYHERGKYKMFGNINLDLMYEWKFRMFIEEYSPLAAASLPKTSGPLVIAFISLSITFL